jgi:hypothetical protein
LWWRSVCRKQPFVRSHQYRLVRNRCRGDEAIGRVAVKAIEFASENGDFAGERQLVT